MIKLVVLDLDQTLIDSIHRFYETFNNVIVSFGGSKVSWDEFFKAYCEDKLDYFIPKTCKREDFWKEFRRRYSSWIHEKDKPMKGALETLKWLNNRGFKIVVTTGREASAEDIWRELRKFKLARYVDSVYTLKDQDPKYEDVLFSRRGLLMKIISKYNVNPKETVFVGDYWVDMLSGSRVGVITVGVLTGCESEEKLKKHGAKYVIKDISSLPKLIEMLEKASNV